MKDPKHKVEAIHLVSKLKVTKLFNTKKALYKWLGTTGKDYVWHQISDI